MINLYASCGFQWGDLVQPGGVPMVNHILCKVDVSRERPVGLHGIFLLKTPITVDDR